MRITSPSFIEPIDIPMKINGTVYQENTHNNTRPDTNTHINPYTHDIASAVVASAIAISSVVGSIALVTSNSGLGGLWMVVNQQQLLILLTMIGSSIHPDVQFFITRTKYVTFSFKELSLRSLDFTKISNQLDNMHRNQTNEELKDLGYDSMCAIQMNIEILIALILIFIIQLLFIITRLTLLAPQNLKILHSQQPKSLHPKSFTHYSQLIPKTPSSNLKTPTKNLNFYEQNSKSQKFCTIPPKNCTAKSKCKKFTKNTDKVYYQSPDDSLQNYWINEETGDFEDFESNGARRGDGEVKTDWMRVKNWASFYLPMRFFTNVYMRIFLEAFFIVSTTVLNELTNPEFSKASQIVSFMLSLILLFLCISFIVFLFYYFWKHRNVNLSYQNDKNSRIYFEELFLDLKTGIGRIENPLMILRKFIFLCIIFCPGLGVISVFVILILVQVSQKFSCVVNLGSFNSFWFFLLFLSI
ncbi:unnamed protein product [Moneuplotes crassus]|uniref:Uncharacterized protein n=1 Tax=Euplotes crassus TaxID=5936 RepID=A0AAD1UJH6_EUPCR|nr:unnamed protein product [Moneuplotes crassus]